MSIQIAKKKDNIAIFVDRDKRINVVVGATPIVKYRYINRTASGSAMKSELIIDIA
jgi:hypothetical protein